MASPYPYPLKVVRQLRTDGPDNTSVGTGVEIGWSNNKSSVLSAEQLRRACPCATCLELRGDTVHSRPLTQPTKGKSSLLRVVSATAEQSCVLEQIWPIGNYALGIRWGDGHDTGIYPYGLLYELSLQEPDSINSTNLATDGLTESQQSLAQSLK